jgi:hypothetical protein
MDEAQQDPQCGALAGAVGPRKPVTRPAATSDERSLTAWLLPKLTLIDSISIAAMRQKIGPNRADRRGSHRFSRMRSL